jgi:hypothetical protein
MIYLDEADHWKEKTEGLAVRMSIVLSLMLSLAAVVVISKHLTNYLWVALAVLAATLFLILYFRNRIVLLGPFAYVATLIVFLGTAVVFGT